MRQAQPDLVSFTCARMCVCVCVQLAQGNHQNQSNDFHQFSLSMFQSHHKPYIAHDYIRRNPVGNSYVCDLVGDCDSKFEAERAKHTGRRKLVLVRPVPCHVFTVTIVVANIGMAYIVMASTLPGIHRDCVYGLYSYGRYLARYSQRL